MLHLKQPRFTNSFLFFLRVNHRVTVSYQSVQLLNNYGDFIHVIEKVQEHKAKKKKSIKYLFQQIHWIPLHHIHMTSTPTPK